MATGTWKLFFLALVVLWGFIFWYSVVLLERNRTLEQEIEQLRAAHGNYMAGQTPGYKDVKISIEDDILEQNKEDTHKIEEKPFVGPPTISFAHISSDMDGLSNEEIQAATCTSKEDVGKTHPCRVVHLISGLKTGSTALAVYLKHSPESDFEVHDYSGPFAEAGKEICWFKSGKQSISQFHNCGKLSAGEPLVGLDACPWLINGSSAKKISCVYPDSKYVILLRDPVQRAISHFNNGKHYRWSGYAAYKVDRWIQELAEKKNRHGFDDAWKLGCYADTLGEFFKYIKGDQILAVQNDAMIWEGTLQKTIDQVSDHFGTQRRNNITVRSVHNLHSKKSYEYPSQDSINKLSAAYSDCNERLFSYLDVRLEHWAGVNT